MQRRFLGDWRGGVLLCLLILGIAATLVVLPTYFHSEAGTGLGLLERTSSLDDGIPKMWDIREAKDGEAGLASLRERAGKNEALVSDLRMGFKRGEEALRQRMPSVKIEYNHDIQIPEVISPDVYKARVEWLTGPSDAKRSDILRNFVKENEELIGVTSQQVDDLVTVADYTNPDGVLSYANLEQRINGIPVFRGEVKAGFRQDGSIIRVINNLAPGIDYGSVSTEFGDPAAAVNIAAGHIRHQLRSEETTLNKIESSDLKAVFGSGDWATTAEKMYFPTEPGVAVPAWRVLIWQPVNAYYVIVDAQTGIVLWHKNITDDQTASATYQVYTNPNAYTNFADGVAPLTPYGGPTSNPAAGTQGAMLSRNNITLIGNEGPLSFNNNGWINDADNFTDGNANEAGLDRVSPNGVDAPMAGDTGCPGAGCRVFTSTWNPPPGNPAPGDDPLTAQAQRGAVIHMFYVMNRYHDELYLRGFTEAARNFQNVNFTGQGVGNDRVSSEGQDSSGTNNANFATPADGGRGRMQMFLWTGPTPDRDGTADTHIIIHEVTHGTSNRLHGNGSGLGNQGGMMGEGWGDFYAHTMTAEPTDDPLGIHGMGGYSLLNLGSGFTANYYYGIRRFPTAVMASTGGPQNKPHNPLTFGHINSNCDTTLGTPSTAVSSAYPRNPVIATSGSCSQVHNAGEIWKSALWEVRGLYVARRGFASGTTAVLDHVTNGMKLAPLNPDMLQERDAIIATALAGAVSPQTAADAADVREGFRIRGMGYSASVQSASSVTEAFDAPTVAGSTATVTSGNNLLEPNECNTLNVALNNNAPQNATGITAVLSSTTAGITVTQPYWAYPEIPAVGLNVANSTPYQVSIDNSVACYTSASFTLTITYTGGGGGSPLVYNFSLPVGIAGNAYTFTSQPGQGTLPSGGTLVAGSQVDDGAVSIPLPSGWTSTVYGVAVTSLSASTNGQMTVNGTASTAFSNTALPASASGGANPSLFPFWDDMDMRTTSMTGGGIYTHESGTAPNREFIIEWRGAPFNDAGTDININFGVVLTEGSSVVKYRYVLTGLGANLNGSSATIGVQRQSTGTEFTQFSFNTPSLTPGLQLTATLPPGQCTPGSGPCSGGSTANPRADFDGDGKTDASVFRPSEGNWYSLGSTAGFAALHWGANGDTIVPGDYDGDGKADFAVFRPDNTEGNTDFYVLNSNGFVFNGFAHGVVGDIAVPGDFDGDHKADIVVWRPSEGNWYIWGTVSQTTTIASFGTTGDKPFAMDKDGDGKANLSVYRSSDHTFYMANATGTPAQNFTAVPWGVDGDKLVPADYDGDNKDDVAVYRPSDGTWYIYTQSGNTITTQFGIASDVPAPGDYDGDGTDDIAVYRGGTWYINGSTSGFQVISFGVASDIPVPTAYIPGLVGGGGGGGGAVTVSYTGPAVLIPDNNPTGITVNLAVSGVGTVSDLNFRFDTAGTCDATTGDTDCGLDHTWVGDLIISVTPPDGSPTVTIIDRPGRTTSGAGCSNNNFGLITLNDEGGLPPIETQANPGPTCTSTLAFPSGDFSPNNPLSALDGENADGTWVITASDNAGGDTGSVRRFSLIFNSGN